MERAIQQARAWIRHACVHHLPRVVALHQESLDCEHIAPEFAIAVAELLGAVRHALEYLTARLQERFVTDPKALKKFAYFPISEDSANYSKKMADVFPGIPAAALAAIDSAQPFRDRAKNGWLVELRDENNRAKHERFDAHSAVPSRRRELRVITDQGGRVFTVPEGGRVEILPGGQLWGDVNIDGGAEGVILGVGRPPPLVTRGRVEEAARWQFLAFTSSGTPVIELIFSAIDGAERIVTDMRTAIGP